MKFMKAFILVIFCMITIGFQTDAHSETIKWYSFQEGVAIGEAQGKQLYIHFMADWCGYCKKMDKDTFSKPEIIAYLNKNFISIKVDTVRERKIAAMFKVKPIPDNRFYSGTGKFIGKKTGYLNPELFMKILTAVMEAGQAE